MDLGFASDFAAPNSMWQLSQGDFLHDRFRAVAGSSCTSHGAEGRPLPEGEKSIQCVGSIAGVFGRRWL